MAEYKTKVTEHITRWLNVKRRWLSGAEATF